MHDLARALGGATYVPGPGLQGWTRSVRSFDREGFALGTVYFGGRDDVHVVSTSAEADSARRAVVGLHGARTARVDTRVDSLADFDSLASILEDAAAQYGSLITRVESSIRGESQGRTVYLGSPSSWVRVRLYEKWLESPGQYVEGTNRVEVQLRPPSKVKERVSAWSPAETFCASKTTRTLAELLGTEVADAASLHVRRGTPTLEESLQQMARQYGRAVDQWLQVSGGDVGRVLEYLCPADAAPPF